MHLPSMEKLQELISKMVLDSSNMNTQEMQKKQFTSYLARCERAGISRLHRTKLPLDLLGIDPNTILAN